MVVRRGSPDEVAIEAGKDASLIVTDRGYMRPQKKWRERVAEEAGCLVTQVESDVVVPVELASGKQEHAARTLRPKIGEYLEDFLVGLTPTKVEKQSTNMRRRLDLSDIQKVLDGMDLDRSVGALSHCTGAVPPRPRRCSVVSRRRASATTTPTATSRRPIMSRT